MFENEDQPSLTAIQWFNKGYDYDIAEDYDNAILAFHLNYQHKVNRIFLKLHFLS